MKRSIYLTDSENLAIQLLAEGKNYRQIKPLCGFPVGLSHLFHAFLSDLKRKTGIKNMQDTAELTDYLAKIGKIDPDLSLTIHQNQLIDDILEGVAPSFRAQRRGVSMETIAAETTETLKTCGIMTRDPRAIRSQLRIFKATRPLDSQNRPKLSTLQWSILRAIANADWTDKVFSEMSVEGIAFQTKEACNKIGVVCPGRNARRNLIRFFLAAHDEREARNAVPHEQTPTMEHYATFIRHTNGMSLEALAEDLNLPIPEAIERGIRLAKRRGFNASVKDIMGKDWVAPENLVRAGESKLTPDDVKTLRYYSSSLLSLNQASQGADYGHVDAFTAEVNRLLAMLEVREKTRDARIPVVAAIVRRAMAREVQRKEALKPQIDMTDPAFN